MSQHQRCQRTLSVSAFHSQVVISEAPVPFQVQQVRASALKLYGTVWEKPSPATQDIIMRLQPWSPGPTVKKPASFWIPAKETRTQQPSAHTIEQLRAWKEKYGRDQRLERHTGLSSVEQLRQPTHTSNNQRQTTSHPYQRTSNPNPTSLTKQNKWWNNENTPWDRHRFSENERERIQ